MCLIIFTECEEKEIQQETQQCKVEENCQKANKISVGKSQRFQWQNRFLEPFICIVTFGHIEFSLQFTRFQKKQSAIFSSNNHAFVRDPRLTKVVLRIEFLKSKLFETFLTVSEQLEQTISNNAQLGVVQWIECYLKITINLQFCIYYDQTCHITQKPLKTTKKWCSISK